MSDGISDAYRNSRRRTLDTWDEGDMDDMVEVSRPLATCIAAINPRLCGSCGLIQDTAPAWVGLVVQSATGALGGFHGYDQEIQALLRLLDANVEVRRAAWALKVNMGLSWAALQRFLDQHLSQAKR